MVARTKPDITRNITRGWKNAVIHRRNGAEVQGSNPSFCAKEKALIF